MNLSIDQVMVEERAAAFAKRSIKTSAKLSGLKLAISMMDLTTLEGKDTPGKVAFVCRKAMQPGDPRYDVPPCAAVCVYPNLVRTPRKVSSGNSGVKVASVATAFPTGLMPLELKLQEVAARASRWRRRDRHGHRPRRIFSPANHNRVSDEIAATKEACGAAHLKVILETGELPDIRQRPDRQRNRHARRRRFHQDLDRQSRHPPPRCPSRSSCSKRSAIIFYETGIRIGMKPAGGIRTAKQALAYLVMVKETLGDDWLTPDLFRFGASTLAQRRPHANRQIVDGNYQSGDYFSLP